MKACAPRDGGSRFRILLTSALLASSFPGCAESDRNVDAAGDQPPAGVVDDEGVEHRFTRPPSRVVSLVPSVTDAMFALGAGDAVVGRTRFDTAAVYAGITSVGGGQEPDIERVLALDPDLVVRFAGPSDPTTPALLDEAGIPVFAVRPERIADVRRMIRRLGTVFDRRSEADSILDAIDRRLDAVRRRARGLAPIDAAFVLEGSPPWVAGDGTYIDELLELSNARNAFADLDRPYAPVSPEQFLSRELDVVLVAAGSSVDPDAFGGAEVREVPPFVELPGPDLGRAAEAVARALRPDTVR